MASETPFGKKIIRAAQEGLREGVKAIPGAIHSKTVMEPSPVKSYALNPFSSPNMSAQKWKKNINNRFRREAAGEIKKRLFSNNNSPAASQKKPILAKATTTTPYIHRPSPYLLKTPINYKAIYTPYNITPREPELRGGARKTRRRVRKNFTRRFVKAKILCY